MLPSALVKGSMTVSGRRISLVGERLDQQAPIAWVPGNKTRVVVTAHTPRLWLRGRVLASRVRFVLKKGTRLYTGPKGGLVGLLTGALVVVPRTYSRGRVSFEFRTPANSITTTGVLLWAPAASFRHDARSAAVPATWSDQAGAPVPSDVASRLDDLFYLFVERAPKGMLALSRCANAAPRIRLLARHGDKLRVTIRPVSAYNGRPGPVLLRGWIYLKPKPRSSGRALARSRMYCVYLARRPDSFRHFAGGRHVTTRPLPLYLSTHPGRAPVGVLHRHASVQVDQTTLVRRGRRRFLRVRGPTLLYVPYHPRLFRRATP